MTSVEKSHPLALKALCTPQIYDDGFQVPIQLYQPLWVKRPSPHELAMLMAAYCVQLDTLLIKNSHQTDSENEGNNRRVSFEHGLSSKAMSIYEQMNATLAKAGIYANVQVYLKESGLHCLFPRVVVHLEDPMQIVDVVNSDTNAYFTHVANLSNLLTMSQQLSSDIQGGESHKYIAYETALLYQCLTAVNLNLDAYKKDVETHFKELRACCAVTDEEPKPKLTDDLEQWLEEITERLSGEATSFKPEHNVLFMPLIKLIYNVPNYE